MRFLMLGVLAFALCMSADAGECAGEKCKVRQIKLRALLPVSIEVKEVERNPIPFRTRLRARLKARRVACCDCGKQ